MGHQHAPGELVVPASSAGELVAPAQELAATFVQSLGASGSAETVRTYAGACERFVGWLVQRDGPSVGPEAFTLSTEPGELQTDSLELGQVP